MNYRDLIRVGLVSLALASGALGTVAGPSGEETRTVDRQTIDKTDPEFWGMTVARTADLGPEVYRARARAYLSRATYRDTRQALSLLQKARFLYPEDAGVLADYAEACAAPYRWTWDRDEAWMERARRALEAARALDAERMEVRRAAGLLAVLDNRLEEAEAEFRQALRLAPDDIETLLRLGGVLRILDRIPEAYEALNRVIDLAPADWRGYSGLGDVFRDDGWYDEALNLYRKARELHVEAFPAHYGKVSVYRRIGYWTFANRFEAELLKRFPDFSNLVLMSAAKTHMDMGRYQHALEELEQISFGNRRGLSDGSVVYWVGMCHRKLGDLAEAEVAFRRALEEFPDSRVASDFGPLVIFQAAAQLAAILEATSRPEEAIDALETASRHPEAPPRLQLELAVKLAAYGLHERAAGALRRGIEAEEAGDRLDERLRMRVALIRSLTADARGGQPADVRPAVDRMEAEVIGEGSAADCYEMVRGYALLGQPDDAVAWLARAIDRGYVRYDAIREDPDLASIRDVPGYRSLLSGK